MTVPNDIELSRKFSSKDVDPIVTEIRFPRYKALEQNLTITFDFPITALVGPNGSNKSSILHALYGAPRGNSLADFWFSTAVDDIDNQQRQNDETLQRFIYKFRTHTATKTVIAECRKARVKKRYRGSEIPPRLEGRTNPDYWEPTKRVQRDRMAKLPVDDPDVFPLLSEKKDRWNQIPKTVAYIDFRAQLPAYDKYLYHAASDQWTRIPSGKKFRILKRAEGLARALAGRPTKEDSNRIIESVRILNREPVECISKILGKNYSSVRLIKHRFYSVDGYSAILKQGDRNYSEAHAGSGEFAIVRLVDAIDNMPANGLLILDEPEVSIHPGAQKALVDYLRSQVRAKGIQVVMSTHSPTIVENLPPQAIKLLGTDPSTGTVSLVSNSTHHSQAFFHLGHTSGLKAKRVMVEDQLVAEIVLRAITLHCADQIGTITPVVFPGGSGNIVKHALTSLALSQATDVVVLLDGDQRIAGADWSMIDNIPATADKRKDWEDLSKALLGTVPKHLANGKDGRADDQSVVSNLNTILRWARSNVLFTHGNVPEAAILAETEGFDIATPTASAKERFREIARDIYGHPRATNVPGADVLSAQRIALAKLNASSPLISSALSAVEAVR